MRAPQEAMIAYLGTLLAIVLLTVVAALVVVFAPVRGGDAGETDLARIIGALAFVGAAVTGLIGVIGTFRPKGRDDVGGDD